MLPYVPTTSSADFTALPMLARLSAAQHDRLRVASFTRNLPAGQVLQREGDVVTSLLVLEAGVIKAGRSTIAGRELVLAVERPPAAFDKPALLAGGPHTATLTALTPVIVRHLPRAVFLDLFDREPSVRHQVLRVLAATLGQRTDQLMDMATLGVPARLAKWLLYRATADPTNPPTGGTVPLPASQALLAAELGTTRVTVNRALRALEAAGVIRVRAGCAVIQDLHGLATRALPEDR
jgi:CRP/FNR family transcriptional regulator